jgi:hypothetical protein
MYAYAQVGRSCGELYLKVICTASFLFAQTLERILKKQIAVPSNSSIYPSNMKREDEVY